MRLECLCVFVSMCLSVCVVHFVNKNIYLSSPSMEDSMLLH